MGKDKKGFTLVELIVVIAIISLLMVIAIPSVLLVQRRINNRSYNTKVELILDAAELYGKDKYASLFSDGSNKVQIKVIDLVPTYLEADVVTKDPETGITTYTVTDPRDTQVSMNDNIIYLIIRNSRVVATMDENAINPDTVYDPNDLNDPRNPASPNYDPNFSGTYTPSGTSAEDNFDFSNGHIVVVAYLDGKLYTTTHSIDFPTPTAATYDVQKSRCNAGAILDVVANSSENKHVASVSNISKQTICMIYFTSK